MKTRKILIGIMFLGIASIATSCFLTDVNHMKYMMVGGIVMIGLSIIVGIASIIIGAGIEAADSIEDMQEVYHSSMTPTPNWSSNELKEKPESTRSVCDINSVPITVVIKGDSNFKDSMKASQYHLEMFATYIGLKKTEGKNEYIDKDGKVFYAGKYGFRLKKVRKPKTEVKPVVKQVKKK